VAEPTTCTSCGAEIEWAVTAAGKRIPLDVGDTPDGNLVLLEDGRAIHRSPATTGTPRRAHFATCPHARRHRRPR
jgi:hypothetical protein